MPSKQVATDKAPFARVDDAGKVLADQIGGLPAVDRAWFSRQRGPFTCGCDQDQPDSAAAAVG